MLFLNKSNPEFSTYALEEAIATFVTVLSFCSLCCLNRTLRFWQPLVFASATTACKGVMQANNFFRSRFYFWVERYNKALMTGHSGNSDLCFHSLFPLIITSSHLIVWFFVGVNIYMASYLETIKLKAGDISFKNLPAFKICEFLMEILAKRAPQEFPFDERFVSRHSNEITKYLWVYFRF